MKKYKINNDELYQLSNIPRVEFKKYVPQIINLANQNAQGTRPKTVGQLSELFPQFLNESQDTSIDAWQKWYLNKMPHAIDDASTKIYQQILNLKEAINTIDLDTIRCWVQDLIINKTYTGLNIQELIIKKIADANNQPYRMANPSEESRGIDGFVGEHPVSIKPTTYDTKQMLNEIIDCEIICYEKKKDGIEIYLRD